MTIFYVVLYHIWRERYQIKGHKTTTTAIYGLAGLRIVLCMMPQNAWLSAAAPLSWGIYRNIPFALMGLIIIVLFYKSAKENNDRLDVADNRPELCLLYSSCTVGGCNSDDRHADDSKNLCIRVDSIDRLQGNEKRNSVKIIFAFKKKIRI